MQRQRMEHRQAAEPEAYGAAEEEPRERAAADPRARGMRPGAEQRGGEKQAQEVALGAAVMQCRPPRADGVAGEEQRGEEGAGHRL